MSSYRLSPRADSDLDGIAAFTIQRWGERKASTYIDDLQKRFSWLAENPMLGRSRDEIRIGLRSYLQGSHLIFYTVSATEIMIAGIPHAAMDVVAYFGEPET